MTTRVRPARRPRWCRYVPGALLVLLAVLTAWPPAPAASRLAALGLPDAGVRVLLAGVGLALGLVLAALADRRPVRLLIVGTTAISLGGNLFAGAWTGLPLALAGLAWAGMLEVSRLFEGVGMDPGGLTLHRVLKPPLVTRFEDVRAVHTSMHGDGTGTLILETEHGTVTAGDLPDPSVLQERIEARLNVPSVEASTESLEASRQRLGRLIGGEGS